MKNETTEQIMQYGDIVETITIKNILTPKNRFERAIEEYALIDEDYQNVTSFKSEDRDLMLDKNVAKKIFEKMYSLNGQRIRGREDGFSVSGIGCGGELGLELSHRAPLIHPPYRGRNWTASDDYAYFFSLTIPWKENMMEKNNKLGLCRNPQ